jgi:endonuclease/exonuclease/phosphatase family metal-dependent hydrolase
VSLLRVATYNVHKCRGWDGKRSPSRIARVLGETGARVVAIQEADRRVGRRAGLLDTRSLEELAGLSLVPVSELLDGHGWHGNALLVGRGVELAGQVHRMSLPGVEPRGALVVDLHVQGWGGLRVACLHLGLLPGCRFQQARALVRFLKSLGRYDGSTLLLGDLNEWRRDSPAMHELHREFSPQPAVASFPAPLPLFPLDRVLGCQRTALLSVEAHSSPLARLASDHLPLVAEVSCVRARLSETDRVGQAPP